ncbi:MAG TPA: GNAT family N-acetyltransferase [Candidatus Nitrosotenuis sp.]|nr:GNAT family N-acetyltransferase [Candidatus Nitrosotenuis sp.]
MIVQESLATTDQLQLRLATHDDRDAILAMYEVFEPKGASLGLPPRKDPGRWLDTLREYPNFIVLDGARVIAHAALCPEKESGEVAVFVHQDYRSRGLGKRLLETLIHEARRMGLRRVWGVTELDNVPMLRLAHSLGFVSAEDPREFYRDLELN